MQHLFDGALTASVMWCNGWRARLECGILRVRAQSGQTNDNKIGICCFSVKKVALRSCSKDWLPRNWDNVSEWSDVSTCGLFQ
jgi:hypothetical protein